jgi:hypothetical protein
MQRRGGWTNTQTGLVPFAGFLDVAALLIARSLALGAASGLAGSVVDTNVRLVGSAGLLVDPLVVHRNLLGTRATLAGWLGVGSSSAQAGTESRTMRGSRIRSRSTRSSSTRPVSRFIPLTVGSRYTGGTGSLPPLAEVSGLPSVVPLPRAPALVVFAVAWTQLAVEQVQAAHSERVATHRMHTFVDIETPLLGVDVQRSE